MATTAFPSITPSRSEVGLRYNHSSFTSPLTGQTQTVLRKGARWGLSMQFDNLQASERGVLQGFLGYLQGQVNYVEIGYPAYTGARGALGVSVEVAGADQTGTQLAIRQTASGTSTISGFLKAGDLVSFDSGTTKELKMVTADFDLASGIGTLAITPPINLSPADAAAIETAAPVGTFMLAGPDLAWSDSGGVLNGSVSLLSSFSVELMEVLPV